MKKLKRGKIKLKNLQIKSLKKAKRLSKALQIIEEECGIHEVMIEIKGCFICPWIDTNDLQNTDMEKLLAELFILVRGVEE